MKISLNVFTERKRAMALPISLIVLLVAGMLVGVSMYVVENLVGTTLMKTENERRLNAALAGLEYGKQRIVDSVLVDTVLPRRGGGFSVASSDITSDTTNFSTLVALGKNNAQFIFDTDEFDVGDPSISVLVYVYDLMYEPEPGIIFSKHFPPRMRYSGSGTVGDGQTVKDGSGDETSLGNFYADPDQIESDLGYYLVRSTASSGGITTTLEQSVIMQR